MLWIYSEEMDIGAQNRTEIRMLHNHRCTDTNFVVNIPDILKPSHFILPNPVSFEVGLLDFMLPSCLFVCFNKARNMKNNCCIKL